MNIKDASKFVKKQVQELEKGIYMFENVVLPRYEVDKTVLAELREQLFKIETVHSKLNEGLEVTDSDWEGIPVQFRKSVNVNDNKDKA